MLTLPFHIRLFFGARQLGTAAACVLAVFVVVAQPAASLAWLGGAHATLEQAALHEAAVEAGHTHHHGDSGHQAHGPSQGEDEVAAHVPRSTPGPEFASAAPYAGPFQELLQTLLQAMLIAPPVAPSPGEERPGAAPKDDLPSQHSPPVLQKPPIPLLPIPVIL